MSAEAPAGLLRARAGRLARLRHAAPPAVHALASQLRRDRRRARPAVAARDGSAPTLAAFFLAVGIGAHALDELNGRPLRRGSPARVLVGARRASRSPPRSAIGIAGAVALDLWLLAFVAVGAFIVCAYNLELFGGRFHSDVWFALAWGAFPLLTALLRLRRDGSAGEAVLAAAFAALSSYAQRRLSSPVRRLRRQVASVSGSLELDDGTPRADHARDADRGERGRAARVRAGGWSRSRSRSSSCASDDKRPAEGVGWRP